MILILTVLCFIFIFHGGFSLFWLLYAWQDKEQIEKVKTPQIFDSPRLSFSALIAARHEASVIEETIVSVNSMDYPEELKEIFVICRVDDAETIQAVQAIFKKLKNDSLHLVIFNDLPINKPHALNIGLQSAKNDIVVVFDAEDQPHKNLYHIANSLMVRQKLHVLQSGVQLMNYRSHWFSALNVLEYYFWFKSTMHYFSKKGVIPLGGNTVFFDRSALLKMDGWDEKCLTEDADIGIRLSVAGARIGVTYDEHHVTQEETPSTVGQFIKQRSRWNQGFLEILLKGDWLKLEGWWRKFLAMYIFITPYAQLLFFVFSFISVYFVFVIKLPIALVLLLMIPFFLLILQILALNIGMFLFCQAYKKPYPVWLPVKISLSFFLYQIMLGISSCRAFFRAVTHNNNWEKTDHVNAHRAFAKEVT